MLSGIFRLISTFLQVLFYEQAIYSLYVGLEGCGLENFISPSFCGNWFLIAFTTFGVHSNSPLLSASSKREADLMLPSWIASMIASVSLLGCSCLLQFFFLLLLDMDCCISRASVSNVGKLPSSHRRSLLCRTTLFSVFSLEHFWSSSAGKIEHKWAATCCNGLFLTVIVVNKLAMIRVNLWASVLFLKWMRLGLNDLKMVLDLEFKNYCSDARDPVPIPDPAGFYNRDPEKSRFRDFFKSRKIPVPTVIPTWDSGNYFTIILATLLSSITVKNPILAYRGGIIGVFWLPDSRLSRNLEKYFHAQTPVS